MNRVTVKLNQDSMIGTTTYVAGDEVKDVPAKFADKLVRAGKATVVGGDRVMDLNKVGTGHEDLNVFQDPEDDSNELGIPYEEQAKNDASPHPVNLETATVPSPSKSNGKPKPPKVD